MILTEISVRGLSTVVTQKKQAVRLSKLTKRGLMTYLNTVGRPAEGTPYLKQDIKIRNPQQYEKNDVGTKKKSPT